MRRELHRADRDASPLLLEVHEVSRSFGETPALTRASLEILPGEIHALAGENGSGKTTLIKIVSGVLRPDGGGLSWEGQVLRLANPAAAQEAGITTVFQETLVVPELSVRDNIFLGTDGLFRHGRSRREEGDVARAALAELGTRGLDISRAVWTLSLAERQIVTIARAIVRPWRLLVLDEATSALDARQRDQLFDYLRSARRKGRSVLFTSHRMDEVDRLADRVSVLRLGETVASVATASTSPQRILIMMAGQETVDRAAEVGEAAISSPPRPQEAVLRVEGFGLGHDDAPPFGLELARGEILGLAGLEGQGQVEFAECLCGLRRPGKGSILLAVGDSWRPIDNFRDTSRRGVAYVPRDRKQEGLFYPLSTLDNFGVASLPEFSRGGILRRSALRRSYRKYADLLRIKARRSGDLVSTLSGGNQQKVLLSRWLATDPRVLVLNDPLRGVDANTKEELYELFKKLVLEGLSIVLLSTEILELLSLCARIAIFHDGRLQAVLPAAGTSDADVVAAMFGHTPKVETQ